MYATTAYLFHQINKVILLDTGSGYFTARYEPMYAKKLILNKGVDNVLLFEFINQEQKPVNITGSTFVFRLISQDGSSVLLSKDMITLGAALGRVKVTIPGSDLSAIQAQPASYSISKSSAGLTTAVFTDAQAQSRAPLDIIDSVFPEFIPSTELHIPMIQIDSQSNYDGTGSAQSPSWQQTLNTPNLNQSNEFYSSHITPIGSTTTIQMDLINFSGTIKAQGAQNYQSIWYNVTDSTTYSNETSTIHMNVVGFHPLLRLAINNSIWASGSIPGTPASADATVVSGVVTNINVIAGGSGYTSAPRVSIVGDGSGATATATVVNGSVSAINVTAGGSGYRPIPTSGKMAQVIIDTGFIDNILYR